jgi:hypothetical protein
VQLGVFYLGVVIDDTVMCKVNALILVEVRMAVYLVDLATGGPSGVGDSDGGPDRLSRELLDESFDAVESGRCIGFFGVLSHHPLALISFVREGDDAGTIVTSVLEEFDSVTQKSFNRHDLSLVCFTVRLALNHGSSRHNAKDAAALRIIVVLDVD